MNGCMLFRCFHNLHTIQVYASVNVCNIVLMHRDPENALFMQQITHGHFNYNIITVCLENYMEFGFCLLQKFCVCEGGVNTFYEFPFLFPWVFGKAFEYHCEEERP